MFICAFHTNYNIQLTKTAISSCFSFSSVHNNYSVFYIPFVFNFSPTNSYTDYGFLVKDGEYDVMLNTDAKIFGGNGLADDSVPHLTNFDPLYEKDGKGWL